MPLNHYFTCFVFGKIASMQARHNNGAKHLIFCYTFAQCVHIMHTWMIMQDLQPLPLVERHLGLLSYAISSRTEPPKLRKWTKTSFFALFCTIYAHYAYLIDSAWPIAIATCWETFRSTIICNIKSIEATKVEKKANVHMCTIYAHCAWTGFMHEL